ncbi:MAG: ROK family protein [Lachnospiraceae bacterium]
MSYRIGVDLGGTNMAAGIVDETYAVVHRKSIKTRPHGTPEEIADDMAELVHELCRGFEIEEAVIELVGIGIPGSISAEGIVEDANNIGFYNVPFERMMQTRLQQERLLLPVKTVNDARAAALGEYLAGAGKGSNTFQMVTIGTGIGGAFIADGKVLTGCNGAAGEIGHMVIERGGIPCSCGRTGCFEVYASASALKERMMRVVPKRPESLLWKLCGQQPERLSGKLLFEAFGKQDALAEELFEEHIGYLAEGIANLINALQPDVLCVGGGMSEQGEALLAPLRAAVAGKIYSRHSAVQTEIRAAALGNAAGIIGAAYCS